MVLILYMCISIVNSVDLYLSQLSTVLVLCIKFCQLSTVLISYICVNYQQCWFCTFVSIIYCQQCWFWIFVSIINSFDFGYLCQSPTMLIVHISVTFIWNNILVTLSRHWNTNTLLRRQLIMLFQRDHVQPTNACAANKCMCNQQMHVQPTNAETIE